MLFYLQEMDSEVRQLLSSHLKFDRDRGVQLLDRCLTNSGEKEKAELCQVFVTLLDDESQPWETKHGTLMGAKCLIPFLVSESGYGDEFLLKIRNLCLTFLTDVEVRVRLGAGEVLGALCRHCGPHIYLECKDVVLDLIQSNLERYIADSNSSSMSEQCHTDKLLEKFQQSADHRRMSAEEIFHDTAGWKTLETSFKALQEIVDGCGKSFLPFMNQDLLDLLFDALGHTNRFVRETGFYVCSSLIECGTKEEGHGEYNPLFYFGHQFSKSLGKGMSDNWSQVRLASSAAARKFLMSFASDEEREIFYPELLPKMCLNRYYLADGVRLYSQETWQLIAEQNGRNLVQKYIKEVVEFYIEQTQADNHAVREASCSCVAELALKIEKTAIDPYVSQLLETLLVCFQDDSWPVRDAACLACGNFVLCFPDECRSSLDSLFPLFFMNLEDNITSVRHGAAAALANVAKAYGEEVMDIILNKLRDGLKAVENQPSESQKFGNLEKGPATFGVVKRMRDNDMELHTDQTMYSCGSLAPKMGRGRLGGCMDRTFRRPSQPWELTDGSVVLMTELSLVPSCSKRMLQFLPLLASATQHRSFTHHIVLLETICKQLPVMAKGIGKQAFKLHLEEFFEPIFYGLSCENALTCSASSQCLASLASILGPSILRGRVEQYNPRLLGQLELEIGNVQK